MIYGQCKSGSLQLQFRGFLGFSAQILYFSFSCFEELSSSNSYFLDFWFGIQALCGCFSPGSCCRVRMLVLEFQCNSWWPLCHLHQECCPFQGWEELSWVQGMGRARGKPGPAVGWLQRLIQLWRTGMHPGQGAGAELSSPGQFLQPPALGWCSWLGLVPATPICERGSQCSAHLSQAEISKSHSSFWVEIFQVQVEKAQMVLWKWRSWWQKLNFSDAGDDRQRLLSV